MTPRIRSLAALALALLSATGLATLAGAPVASAAANLVTNPGFQTSTLSGCSPLASAVTTQLAADHGQAGWHAHAFPLSVDGIEIVASLVLLADRRHGRRSGWLPWAALIIGTAGSLAANVATAGPGTISRLIAGWPALALLIAVKLLSGMLGQRTTSPLAALPSGPAGDQNTSEPPLLAVPIPSRSPSTARPTTAAPAARRGCPVARKTSPRTGADSRTIHGLPTDLLSAARAARDSLQRDGHRPTRDAIAARLRQNGHPVRNSRLTPLLQTLYNESTAPPPASTN